MKPMLCVFLAVIGVVGCATPFRPPSEAAHIVLQRADSPFVSVDKIWLAREGAGLVVKGYVIRQLRAETTEATHLDVTFYDAAGQVIHTQKAEFEPHEIPRHRRPTGVSRYSVPLGLPVAKVAKIEVRAHDGRHDST